MEPAGSVGINEGRVRCDPAILTFSMSQWIKILAEKDDVIVRISPEQARLIREVIETKRAEVMEKIQQEGPLVLWTELRDAIDQSICQIDEQLT